MCNKKKKGGFKKFAEMCPEFCVLKEASQMNQRAKEQHIEPDIRQSDIDNAVMTQIMPYLYLGKLFFFHYLFTILNLI